MTAKTSIDPVAFLHEHLSQASPDLLRELMQSFVNTLLSADADSVCGAAYGARAPEPINLRNGYRHRDLDTRIGTLDVAIPKLREGSYFPEWLLERRRRADAALTSVVATCYLHGSEESATDGWTDTYDISGADVLQVIDWAQRQAGDSLTYAVALVHDDEAAEQRNPGHGRGLVWLVGMDGNDTATEPQEASSRSGCWHGVATR